LNVHICSQLSNDARDLSRSAVSMVFLLDLILHHLLMVMPDASHSYQLLATCVPPVPTEPEFVVVCCAGHRLSWERALKGACWAFVLLFGEEKCFSVCYQSELLWHVLHCLLQMSLTLLRRMCFKMIQPNWTKLSLTLSSMILARCV